MREAFQQIRSFFRGERGPHCFTRGQAVTVPPGVSEAGVSLGLVSAQQERRRLCDRATGVCPPDESDSAHHVRLGRSQISST